MTERTSSVETCSCHEGIHHDSFTVTEIFRRQCHLYCESIRSPCGITLSCWYARALKKAFFGCITLLSGMYPRYVCNLSYLCHCHLTFVRLSSSTGMPGTFSPQPRVSDPNMHHSTCVTHVPWCMPGSLTNGFLWSRWSGKRSRHTRTRRLRNPQFCASGKNPCYVIPCGGLATEGLEEI